MRPFAEYRMWLREGPQSEKRMVAVGGLLLVALLIWVLVPQSSANVAVAGGGSGVDSGASAVSPASGGVSRPGATGLATAVGAGGSPQAPGGAGRAVASTGGASVATGSQALSSGPGATIGSGVGTASSDCLAGSATGVTAKEVKLGVVIVDIGNTLDTALTLPSYNQMVDAYNAVIGSYNKAGGVWCRQIVPVYYHDNFVDASSEQALCLQIQQDGDFAVLNNLYNPQEITCIAQEKVPNFWYTPPHTNAMQQYYPYILSPNYPDYNRLIEDYVQGDLKLDWFKGMKKVGITEQSCYPDENTALQSDLTAAGINSSRWVVYNYGCNTSSGPTPDQNTEAALQFKSAGVTNVMTTAYQSLEGFAEAAQSQNFVPKYSEMEDSEVSASDHESPNGNPSSMNGALGIVTDQVGADDTPGLPTDPATTACNKILTSAGLPSTSASGNVGTLLGNACTMVGVFVAAANHSTTIGRTTLAAGLARVGAMQLSYPAGPANYTNPSDPAGGQYWRADTFFYSCNCWKVTEPTFYPGA